MMADAYTVESIEERKRINEAGRIERFYVLTAKTTGGTRFTVDLSEDEADVKKAKGIVTERAKRIDSLRGM